MKNTEGQKARPLVVLVILALPTLIVCALLVWLAPKPARKPSPIVEQRIEAKALRVFFSFAFSEPMGYSNATLILPICHKINSSFYETRRPEKSTCPAKTKKQSKRKSN
jgi:hypothetical protein